MENIDYLDGIDINEVNIRSYREARTLLVEVNWVPPMAGLMLNPSQSWFPLQICCSQLDLGPQACCLDSTRTDEEEEVRVSDFTTLKNMSAMLRIIRPGSAEDPIMVCVFPPEPVAPYAEMVALSSCSKPGIMNCSQQCRDHVLDHKTGVLPGQTLHSIPYMS